MALIDLPATIDYILGVTGFKQVIGRHGRGVAIRQGWACLYMMVILVHMCVEAEMHANLAARFILV